MSDNKYNLEFIYEQNQELSNKEARIIKVKDIKQNIIIDIVWNNENVDTAFCNFIIKMACTGRGISKVK